MEYANTIWTLLLLHKEIGKRQGWGPGLSSRDGDLDAGQCLRQRIIQFMTKEL